MLKDVFTSNKVITKSNRKAKLGQYYNAEKVIHGSLLILEYLKQKYEIIITTKCHYKPNVKYITCYQ